MKAKQSKGYDDVDIDIDVVMCVFYATRSRRWSAAGKTRR